MSSQKKKKKKKAELGEVNTLLSGASNMCHMMESPQSAMMSRSVGRGSLYPRDIIQMLLPDLPGDSGGW